MSNTSLPPEASRISHKFKCHNIEFDDPYHYIRTKSKQVLDYIDAENAYYDKITTHTTKLQEKLYNEFVSRMQETDESVPYKHGNFYYYTRYEKGKQYKIYCRKPIGSEKEQIILDPNQIAKDKKLDYIYVGPFRVSPSHKILAYGLDTKGDEIYTVYFKDLETMQLLEDTLTGCGSQVQFLNDNKTVFYTKRNKSHRPYRVYKHQLGNKEEEDQLVYEEKDDRFYMYLQRSSSQKYLFMIASSNASNEYYYMDADKGDKWNLLLKRIENIEYDVSHHGEYFYVRDNLNNATNFRLVRISISSPSLENAEVVLEHDPKRTIRYTWAFKDFIVISIREEGLHKLMIYNPKDKSSHMVKFPDPGYQMRLEDNKEYDTNFVRLLYSSFITPRSTFDYDVIERKLILRKETPCIGYKREQYKMEKIEITARDGTKVPVMLFYKKQNEKPLEKNGKHPLVLSGYGAYGVNNDPSFNSKLLSYLDRGCIYAKALIRGGEENGRLWYENGKLMNKKNTFYDFIDCAHALIKEGYTSKDKLAIYGASAGGLLIGSVLHMEPDLCRAAVLDVPFVDIINTLLDTSIPLTVTEYDEWGNPNDKKAFDYMLSYSPYDNIDTNSENFTKQYPAVLVTSGLNDPRVGFWEPTKWVARMRYYYKHIKKGKGTDTLLLKTFTSGHSGASGRYEYLKEAAIVYAFVLDQLGCNECK